MRYWDSVTIFYQKQNKKLIYVFWLSFITLAFCHLSAILRNGVNILFWDEWNLFTKDSFLLDPSWHSLFKQHNEHRLVVPNLYFYFFSMVSGFDIWLMRVTNFLVFVGLSVFFIRRTYDSRSGVLGYLKYFVLLSGLNYENHYWPFQIQWHMNVLFIMLLAASVIKNEKTKLDLGMCLVFPFLIVFSLGSGFFALVGLILFQVVKTITINRKSRQEIIFTLGLIFSSGFAFLVFISGYKRPEYHPELALPYKKEFWDHFSAVLSLGTGNIQIEGINGGLFLFFVSIVLLLWGSYKILSRIEVRPFFHYNVLILLTFLCMVLPISMSRAGFGASQGLSSRYFEFSIVIFLSSLCLVESAFFHSKQRFRILATILLILILWEPIRKFHLQWDFQKKYSDIYHPRLVGRACFVDNVIKNSPSFKCPTLYPDDLAPIVESIKLSGKEFKFMDTSTVK